MVRTVELTEQQLARRRRFSRYWLVASVAWSLVRTAIVWAALGKYGVDPVVYLLIDLASALILAWSMPKLVTSLIDKRHRPAIWAGAATLAGYIVPDVYIFMSSSHLPYLAVAVLLAVIYVSVAVGGVSLRRKVIKGRLARAKAAADAAA